mgnify:CR=1 FL=1
MRYTVTVEKEAKISSGTSLAIQKFKDMLKSERKTEQLQGELEMWLKEIPKDEFNAYVEITEEMRNRIEQGK